MSRNTAASTVCSYSNSISVYGCTLVCNGYTIMCYIFNMICFILSFVRNRLAAEIHLHYLKSSVYFLDLKVSGYQHHYEIHKPPPDICWNLED